MSNDLDQHLLRALKEIESLKQENRSLKRQLSNFSNLEEAIPPTQSLSTTANELRGREDVYPVRWTNKAGKSGYSPA
jgi:hypothetical protein